MRLDKFLASNSDYSRREIKLLVRRGLVSVNGSVVSAFDEHIASHDDISIDGTFVRERKNIYLMLNKLPGYVCARRDSEHPTVLDLLRRRECFDGDTDGFENIAASALQIVGRLDKDTSGLLLLSTDGDWNHAVSSPRRQHSKTYLAGLAEPISESYAEHFLKGIHLRGDDKITRAATLEIVSERCARVCLSEGRYHQVKRMFAALGNRVVTLHRESVGSLSLQNLAPGHFRLLSDAETQSFFRP